MAEWWNIQLINNLFYWINQYLNTSIDKFFKSINQSIKHSWNSDRTWHIHRAGKGMTIRSAPIAVHDGIHRAHGSVHGVRVKAVRRRNHRGVSTVRAGVSELRVAKHAGRRTALHIKRIAAHVHVVVVVIIIVVVVHRLRRPAIVAGRGPIRRGRFRHWLIWNKNYLSFIFHPN